ncbi:hypothetical protein [Mesorhizobium retamae]|uniref:Uncharacterized protein n=1 Tax=Mesorhizobium retamae TaxID=2912854 RepID=A0ABS9QJM0_9HYPH|nr:hypothetical protein [Mesorhizobium sp. IRAMC:0171]MCG7507028.1 hypothetical protein [Mesorhizobium sp. IRAMC:0171]
MCEYESFGDTRERVEKESMYQDRQQDIIDVLMAAAIDAHKQIAAEWGKNHSRLDKLNAALALAKGERK